MTRLGDALHDLSAAGIFPPARTSALDLLTAPAAPAQAEPADALSDLLAVEPAVGLSPDDEADIVLLDRLKQDKARHVKAAEALGKDISRIEIRLMELAVEHGLINAKGRIDLGAVDNGHGFMVKPYEMRTLYPKYRDDPDTDQPYTREQLISALRAAGLDHLVIETTEQHAYPGYLRDRVNAWQQAAGAAGVRDADGNFVDLDGELLDATEALDPVADILALPRALRAVIEPVYRTELRFTRRAIPAPPAPAVEVDAAPTAD